MSRPWGGGGGGLGGGGIGSGSGRGRLGSWFRRIEGSLR